MQLEDTPVSPREMAPAISWALDAAVMRALEKRPDARWPTAEEFSAALAATPEGPSSASPSPAPVAAPADARPSAPPGRRRRRRWPWIVALVLLPAVVLGGLWCARHLGYIDVPFMDELEARVR